MASVFTKIIQGELPSYKLMEDKHSIAILALDQVTLGHTLVIPKIEVDHWFDVPTEAFLQVQRNSQILARALQKATQCPRVMTATVGFEVPHCHLHLIPAWSMADLNFARGVRRTPEEMKSIQERIIGHLHEAVSK
ncbi:MAG: HIT family protein [Bdellovibrio sp.]|nr:MAG: HIT family protein [Bdellovibrio sp.]